MKMQSKIIRFAILFFCVSYGFADTFRHKESGDVFTGFVTQKVASGKTLVYNSDEGKMTPVVLSDYEISFDNKGRRDTVALIFLNKPDVFLSPTVSKEAAKTIIDASNKGPQAIILQIDGPGGRGDAMKTIADAVLQSDNCPVFAYISEGAYSAAAIVAMACDQVFIKSTAGIGAVGSSARNQDFGEHLSIYNTDFQLNDFIYATVLAQKNDRPELLTRALIDMSISIIQVANEDGSKTFVEEKDRQQRQRLIRTLCKGVSEAEMDKLSPTISTSMEASRSSANVSARKSASISPTDLVGKVLNLTASEAVELGIANDTAESTDDILNKMQLSDAKLVPVPSIEKILKKFAAAQRTISDGLFRIEQYERDIATLSNQFSTIDNQLRTGTQTREISRGDVGYRSNRRREVYSSYDDQDIVRSGRSRDSRNQPRSQTVTTREPRVDIQIVYTQLTATLENAVGEYRRVLNFVDRWPGGLPPTISREMLQNDMDSASAELDRLYRYQPIYPLQGQQQIPGRRPTNSRRY